MSGVPLRGFEDFRDFVNPLIYERVETMGEPYRWARVVDGQLLDADQRVIDDFISGWGTQLFGHRNPVVTQALREFLDSDAPSFFTSGVSPFAGALARRLSERTDGAYDAVFFANGGTEAVEAGLKLARAASGRTRILGLQGAYHGCTFGSCALMHPGEYRDSFAPHLPDVSILPWEDIEALESALSKADVAAVVVEPIQVEAGVRAPSGPYLRALCELTDRYGALLIADEIQTGLGRTGKFLASEIWPRRPDMVVLGKGLGGGVMPVSALLTQRSIFQRAYGSFERAEAHNSTFGGNALSCVASLTTLDLLSPHRVEQAARQAAWFSEALAQALSGAPLVAEVRSYGMLIGIALRDTDVPWLNFEYLGLGQLAGKPAVGLLLCHRLYKAGFITSVCGHNWSVVRLQPPLNTDEQRLRAFISACAEAVEQLCRLQ